MEKVLNCKITDMLKWCNNLNGEYEAEIYGENLTLTQLIHPKMGSKGVLLGKKKEHHYILTFHQIPIIFFLLMNLSLLVHLSIFLFLFLYFFPIIFFLLMNLSLLLYTLHIIFFLLVHISLFIFFPIFHSPPYLS